MRQYYNKEDLKKFQQMFSIQPKAGYYDTYYLQKTKKYFRILQYIPGILFVWVGNSVSMNHSNKDSDIDLFIITKNNHLWWVRIILTFIFQILGVRKNNKHHAGRFCLSFFCSEDGMDFSSWALKKDPYLFFWIVYLKPIINKNKTYESFLKTNEKWAFFDEQFDIIEENKKHILPSKNHFWDHISFQLFDVWCKKIFLPKTIASFEKLEKPYGVKIEENLLKFHNNDIRIEISKNF